MGGSASATVGSKEMVRLRLPLGAWLKREVMQELRCDATDLVRIAVELFAAEVPGTASHAGHPPAVLLLASVIIGIAESRDAISPPRRRPKRVGVQSA